MSSFKDIYGKAVEMVQYGSELETVKDRNSIWQAWVSMYSEGVTDRI